MADALNQSPRFRYEVLRNRFFKAYHQPTSGSAGSAILKWLHEDIPDMDGNPAFLALERAASVLQEKGDEDAHPMLYSQITGAFETLMADCIDMRYGAPTPRDESDYLQSEDDWNYDIQRGNL